MWVVVCKTLPAGSCSKLPSHFTAPAPQRLRGQNTHFQSVHAALEASVNSVLHVGLLGIGQSSSGPPVGGDVLSFQASAAVSIGQQQLQALPDVLNLYLCVAQSLAAGAKSGCGFRGGCRGCCSLWQALWRTPKGSLRGRGCSHQRILLQHRELAVPVVHSAREGPRYGAATAEAATAEAATAAVGPESSRRVPASMSWRGASSAVHFVPWHTSPRSCLE